MSNSQQTVPDVSVAQLEAYLQQKQWFADGEIRKIATIWHQAEHEDAEVVLPLPDARDFSLRIRDAVSALAVYERREAFQVLADIKRLFSNVITVRVIHADTKEGTIPIADGVLLISKAKDLLTAAAQSLYAKRKHFTGPTPKDAKAYLETLLLGQTEIGSYVVNVIAPSQDNAFIEHTDAEEVVPLAKAITSSLVTGLEALGRASIVYEEQENLKAFDEAVLSGASANLCDALLGFSGVKRNRRFEITVSAAAGPLFESEPKKFEFDERTVEVLTKASGYYKDDYILEQRRLTGFITDLSQVPGKAGGKITVHSTLGDVQRKVRMELTDDDYHMAVLAHDNKQMVRVEGDVHVKSKTAELLNPLNFGVIKEEDLF